jgi:hypothetical protein
MCAADTCAACCALLRKGAGSVLAGGVRCHCYYMLYCSVLCCIVPCCAMLFSSVCSTQCVASLFVPFCLCVLCGLLCAPLSGPQCAFVNAHACMCVCVLNMHLFVRVCVFLSFCLCLCVFAYPPCSDQPTDAHVSHFWRALESFDQQERRRFVRFAWAQVAVRTVLCCVVYNVLLCCVVLCCAVLCCVVLCCIVLCGVVWCDVVWCGAFPWTTILIQPQPPSLFNHHPGTGAPSQYGRGMGWSPAHPHAD